MLFHFLFISSLNPFLAGGSAFDTPPEEDYDCSNKENGMYGVGCNSYFFWCWDQQASRYRCDDGRYFSQSKRGCEFFENVEECAGNTAPLNAAVPKKAYPIKCKSRTDGNYPHPMKHCHNRFYSCAGGRTFERHCPFTLKYDGSADKCDWDRYIEACGGTKRLTVADEDSKHPVLDPKCPPTGEELLVALKPCSTRYIHCWNGRGRFEYCGDNEAFDENSRKCQPTSSMQRVCQTTPEKPEKSKVCPDHSGRVDVPFATCDSRYYECNNGVERLRHCKQGTVFDSSDRFCKSQKYVNECQEQQTIDDKDTTTTTTTPKCPSYGGQSTLAFGTCDPRFLRCDNGVGEVFECPETELYDVSSSGCKIRSAIKTCVDENNENSRCPATGTAHLALAYCDPRYLECFDGAGKVRYCETNFMFDKQTGVCQHRDQVSSCQQGLDTAKSDDRCLRSGEADVPIGVCLSRYIRCWNGKGREEECPTGQLFDSSSQKCLLESVVQDCLGTSPKDATENSACPVFGGGDFPLQPPTHCAMDYLRCWNGHGAQRRCVAGNVFDLLAKRCRERSVVKGCGTDSSSGQHASCPANGKGFYQLNDCSQKFVYCRNGNGVEHDCSDGYVFDSLSQRCRDQDMTDGCKKNTGQPGQNCPPKGNGDYQLKTCHSQYLRCANGVGQTASCSLGSQVFDPISRSCLERVRVRACFPTLPPTSPGRQTKETTSSEYLHNLAMACPKHGEADIEFANCDSRFIRCWDAKATLLQCTIAGQVFDPATSSCQSRDLVDDCDDIDDKNIHDTRCPKYGKGDFSLTLCSSSYAKCDNGEATILSCTNAGDKFDSVTQRCRPEKDVLGCKTEDKMVCPSAYGDFGLQDCSSTYIRCADSEATRVRCSDPDDVFDADTRACRDRLAVYKCNPELLKHTTKVFVPTGTQSSKPQSFKQLITITSGQTHLSNSAQFGGSKPDTTQKETDQKSTADTGAKTGKHDEQLNLLAIAYNQYGDDMPRHVRDEIGLTDREIDGYLKLLHNVLKSGYKTGYVTSGSFVTGPETGYSRPTYSQTGQEEGGDTAYAGRTDSKTAQPDREQGRRIKYTDAKTGYSSQQATYSRNNQKQVLKQRFVQRQTRVSYPVGQGTIVGYPQQPVRPVHRVVPIPQPSVVMVPHVQRPVYLQPVPVYHQQPVISGVSPEHYAKLTGYNHTEAEAKATLGSYAGLPAESASPSESGTPVKATGSKTRRKRQSGRQGTIVSGQSGSPPQFGQAPPLFFGQPPVKQQHQFVQTNPVGYQQQDGPVFGSQLPISNGYVVQQEDYGQQPSLPSQSQPGYEQPVPAGYEALLDATNGYGSSQQPLAGYAAVPPAVEGYNPPPVAPPQRPPQRYNPSPDQPQSYGQATQANKGKQGTIVAAQITSSRPPPSLYMANLQPFAAQPAVSPFQARATYTVPQVSQPSYGPQPQALPQYGPQPQALQQPAYGNQPQPGIQLQQPGYGNQLQPRYGGNQQPQRLLGYGSQQGIQRSDLQHFGYEEANFCATHEDGVYAWGSCLPHFVCCFHGDFKYLTCPDLNVFDWHSGKCVLEQKCVNVKKPPVNPAPPKTICSTLPNGLYAVASCELPVYLSCWEGQLEYKPCQPGYLFKQINDQFGFCVPKQQCQPDPEPVTPVYPEPREVTMCERYGNGVFPFSESCEETFISCVNGVYRELYCPRAHLFHPQRRQCVAETYCQRQPVTPPVPQPHQECAGRPEGAFAFGHCFPNYGVCWNRQFAQHSCIGTYLFSEDLKACVPERKCQPEKLPNYCEGKPDGVYAHAQCEAQFICCALEVYKTLDCPAHHVFDVTKAMCVITPECNAEPTTEVVPPHDVCYGQSNGARSIAPCIGIYAVCWEGRLSYDQCDPGSVYNDDVGACVPPVKCGPEPEPRNPCANTPNGAYIVTGDCGKEFGICWEGEATFHECECDKVFSDARKVCMDIDECRLTGYHNRQVYVPPMLPLIQRPVYQPQPPPPIYRQQQPKPAPQPTQPPRPRYQPPRQQPRYQVPAPVTIYRPIPPIFRAPQQQIRYRVQPPNPCESGGDKAFGFDKDCLPAYQQCEYGILKTVYCGNGYLFDRNTNACLPKEKCYASLEPEIPAPNPESYPVPRPQPEIQPPTRTYLPPIQRPPQARTYLPPPPIYRPLYPRPQQPSFCQTHETGVYSLGHCREQFMCCHGGVDQLINCPAWQVFDSKTFTCVAENECDVTAKPQTPYVTMPRDCTEGEAKPGQNSQQHRFGECLPVYAHCENGQWVEKMCEGGYVFDTAINACDPLEKCFAINNHHQPNPATLTKYVVQPPPTGVCTNSKDGVIPHGSCENVFICCTDQQTKYLKCPPGHKFDAQKFQCVLDAYCQSYIGPAKSVVNVCANRYDGPYQIAPCKPVFIGCRRYQMSFENCENNMVFDAQYRTCVPFYKCGIAPRYAAPLRPTTQFMPQYIRQQMVPQFRQYGRFTLLPRPAPQQRQYGRYTLLPPFVPNLPSPPPLQYQNATQPTPTGNQKKLQRLPIYGPRSQLQAQSGYGVIVAPPRPVYRNVPRQQPQVQPGYGAIVGYGNGQQPQHGLGYGILPGPQQLQQVQPGYGVIAARPQRGYGNLQHTGFGYGSLPGHQHQQPPVKPGYGVIVTPQQQRGYGSVQVPQLGFGYGSIQGPQQQPQGYGSQISQGYGLASGVVVPGPLYGTVQPSQSQPAYGGLAQGYGNRVPQGYGTTGSGIIVPGPHYTGPQPGPAQPSYGGPVLPRGYQQQPQRYGPQTVSTGYGNVNPGYGPPPTYTAVSGGYPNPTSYGGPGGYAGLSGGYGTSHGYGNNGKSEALTFQKFAAQYGGSPPHEPDPFNLFGSHPAYGHGFKYGQPSPYSSGNTGYGSVDSAYGNIPQSQNGYFPQSQNHYQAATPNIGYGGANLGYGIRNTGYSVPSVYGPVIPNPGYGVPQPAIFPGYQNNGHPTALSSFPYRSGQISNGTAANTTTTPQSSNATTISTSTIPTNTTVQTSTAS